MALRASGRESMTVVTGPLFSIVTAMDLLLSLSRLREEAITARSGPAPAGRAGARPSPSPSCLLISVCGASMPVPAMSRCAQGVSLTKRCRNCAAVIEPPWRPPVFFMSANFESIILS